jgi:hypothetical protein
MTFGKILSYIGWTILFVILVSIFLLWRACNNGDLYQAGSGLGSVTRIDKYKFKSTYYERYADTLLDKFPKYRVPNDDPSIYMTQGYEFLNMTKFYFDKSPKEIYCVQWQGIDVRMAYNIDSNKSIIENPRNNILVPTNEKERMRNRLQTEIIDKLDSLIENSVDKDSAILKISF